MENDTSTPKTLLAALEPYTKTSNVSKEAVHPFDLGAAEATQILGDLIQTTGQLSNSLRVYESSAQWTNPKLVSLLRQHSNNEHTVLTASKGVEVLIETLKNRSGVDYGENIPLDSAAVPVWCIEQFDAWGRSVGMEIFKDDSKPGAVTFALGGKFVMIDFEFTIDRTNPEKPGLKIASAKSSHVLETGNEGLSTLLDAFLAETFQAYCDEMQKGEEARDSQRAAALRRATLAQLKYLVLLDGLASRKEDGAIKWFTDMDELCPILTDLARNESLAVAGSLRVQKAPLDVFLLRSHSLPLPYHVMPSLSFLVHISPVAYLTLLHKVSPSTPGDTFPLDIPMSVIKPGLKKLTQGVTIATLYLTRLSDGALFLPSMSMSNVMNRPAFPLHQTASEIDHTFRQIDSFIVDSGVPGLSASGPTIPPPVGGPYAWVLDFTDGGKNKGVVMNQSRIRAVELVVNPLGGGSGLNAVADVLSIGSWIDRLLNPDNLISSERYTSLYKSPNNRHPPLQLRLTAPEEPGYLLQRVPVHTLKEVLGILEIVREQCWLNETLLSCDWSPEGLTSNDNDAAADEAGATDAELQSILAGTFAPRKLPINVSLPSPNTTESDPLFGPSELEFSAGSKPRIVMTSPERAPISGLVEITVAYDETESRGIGVSIQGAMGLDVSMANLAEVCRRGGTWGLPGRIWASGHHNGHAW